MKTSKILTLSLAAGVAGVAVAEFTGARALFVSGEIFFSGLAFAGIAAIAVTDLLRHRKQAGVEAEIINPALVTRPKSEYFARHSQVKSVKLAA